MDKDLFIKTIKNIQQLVEEQDNFNNILHQIDPEFGGGYIYNKPIQILIDLLKILIDDKYDNINYYMWELNFGKDYTDGCITDANDNIIKLQTPEDLYNLIMSDK